MALSIETYVLAKKYTDKVTRELATFDIKIVDSLPTHDISTHTIYFVPMQTVKEQDSYFEYIFINGIWELIGTTQIDLSDYYTKKETEDLIEEKKYVLPTASDEILGGVKIDTSSLNINEDGVVSMKESKTEEIAQKLINESIIDSDDIEKLFSEE